MEPARVGVSLTEKATYLERLVELLVFLLQVSALLLQLTVAPQQTPLLLPTRCRENKQH